MNGTADRGFQSPWQRCSWLFRSKQVIWAPLSTVQHSNAPTHPSRDIRRSPSNSYTMRVHIWVGRSLGGWLLTPCPAAAVGSIAAGAGIARAHRGEWARGWSRRVQYVCSPSNKLCRQCVPRMRDSDRSPLHRVAHCEGLSRSRPGERSPAWAGTKVISAILTRSGPSLWEGPLGGYRISRCPHSPPG